MKWFMWGLAVVVVLAASFGAFKLVPLISYKLSYEGMVKRTVCQMVKPEYLREPCPAGSDRP
jgi:hypothetical protein